MAVNPIFQLVAASGTLFAVTLGREVIQGFIARLLSGRIVQAMGFLIAIGLAVALGGQWVLARFGQSVSGTVERKLETAEIQRDGSWIRTTELVATYNAGRHQGALEVTVPVSTEVYDVARVGKAVPLRCVPLFQALCLLKYDSVGEWEWRRALGLAGGRESMFLLGLGLAVFWLGFAEWDASRPGKRLLGRGLFAAWSAALLYSAAQPDQPAMPAGPLQQGAARVTSLRVFEKYEFLQPLLDLRYPHPFVVAELSFLPAPGKDPVLAVDGVDRAFAAGLRVGATVAVVVPVSDPRAARIAGASREFVRGNVPKEVGLTLLLLLMVVGPVILVERLRRRSVPPSAAASLHP
jgi:hypothetical protein